MKNVQISKELFFNLIRYHFAGMDEFEEAIKTELQQKLNSMVLREHYTAYKTAPTEHERAEAYKKYLNEKIYSKAKLV